MGLYDHLIPTPAERALIDATAAGRVCDFTDGGKKDSDAKNGAAWGEERTVRAEIIAALATGARTDWPVTTKGIQIGGARIVGGIDLAEATVVCRLAFSFCYIDQRINLFWARTRSIYIRDCYVEVPTGMAIRADGLRCEGDFFIRKSTVCGEVRFLGADIGGDLSCAGAKLENKQEDGSAFAADRLKTGGSAFLDNLVAKGEVRLLGADIGGDLSCTDAKLENEQKDGKAFNAEGMKVAGAMFWREFEQAPVGIVDLTHTKIGQLVDDPAAWPDKGKLFIDGFEYGAITGGAPTDEDWRRDWLNLMPKESVWLSPERRKPVFWPQPYEQLAKVLRQMGHERAARKIAMAKQDAFLEHLEKVPRSFLHKLWLRIIGPTIGYGYEPWRALYGIAALMIVGSIIFAAAFHVGAIHPSKERVYMSECYVVREKFPAPIERPCAGWRLMERYNTKKPLFVPADYPEFQPIIYTADTLLPFVDLRQEDYWLPGDMGWPFLSFRGYLWLHIMLGWFLTTMFVVGITGIVKKD